MADPSPPPTAPGTNTPVQLDLATARRIAEATKYVEKMYRLTPTQRRPNRGGGDSSMIARVTLQLTARGNATYGRGKGYLQLDNGTTLYDDVDTGLIEIKNLSNQTYGPGTYAFVPVFFSLGAYWSPAPASCALIGVAISPTVPATSAVVTPPLIHFALYSGSGSSSYAPTVILPPFKQNEITPP